MLLAVVVGFVAGLGVQWLAFEKEMWAWDVRSDQRAMRVRIDRLERQDLRSLLDALEEHGAEIDRALLVLGWHQLEGEEKK